MVCFIRAQHLKQRTAHALNEVAVLRDELEKTEAAVVGGKKKRDSDVAERESQLRRCQEEIRRLESEVGLGFGPGFARDRRENIAKEYGKLDEEVDKQR